MCFLARREPAGIFRAYGNGRILRELYPRTMLVRGISIYRHPCSFGWHQLLSLASRGRSSSPHPQPTQRNRPGRARGLHTGLCCSLACLDEGVLWPICSPAEDDHSIYHRTYDSGGPAWVPNSSRCTCGSACFSDKEVESWPLKSTRLRRRRPPRPCIFGGFSFPRSLPCELKASTR